jgi:CsoR family transcriptional regulator, copper-sensing transcriptional repressor
VPTVFLTRLDGTAETAGTVINWVSGAVLVAEAAVLFAVSRDKKRWLRKHARVVALVC